MPQLISTVRVLLEHGIGGFKAATTCNVFLRIYAFDVEAKLCIYEAYEYWICIPYFWSTLHSRVVDFPYSNRESQEVA